MATSDQPHRTISSEAAKNDGEVVSVIKAALHHGVIPGRGVCPALPPAASATAAGFTPGDGDARRITLMIAFWKTVEAGPLLH